MCFFLFYCSSTGHTRTIGLLRMFPIPFQIQYKMINLWQSHWCVLHLCFFRRLFNRFETTDFYFCSSRLIELYTKSTVDGNTVETWVVVPADLIELQYWNSCSAGQGKVKLFPFQYIGSCWAMGTVALSWSTGVSMAVQVTDRRSLVSWRIFTRVQRLHCEN